MMYNRLINALAVIFCIQAGVIMVLDILRGFWFMAVAKYLLVGVMIHITLYLQTESLNNHIKVFAWMPSMFSQRIREWMWE